MASRYRSEPRFAERYLAGRRAIEGGGHHCRSYLFAPHRKVIDHQRGTETPDVDGVLAGRLELLGV